MRLRSLSFSTVCCIDVTLCFFFFFSSRRRHTRFDCDWSSDVCSSDLRERRFAALELPPHRDATLALRHIFPGGPGDVDGSRRIGIGRYFSRRERARVVGARIPAHVGGGRERPPVPKREVPPRVEVTEVGVGMLPLAGVVEP